MQRMTRGFFYYKRRKLETAIAVLGIYGNPPPGGGLPFGGGAVYFSSCFCTACTMRAIAALSAALTANSTRKFTPMNATNRK